MGIMYWTCCVFLSGDYQKLPVAEQEDENANASAFKNLEPQV